MGKKLPRGPKDGVYGIPPDPMFMDDDVSSSFRLSNLVGKLAKWVAKSPCRESAALISMDFGDFATFAGFVGGILLSPCSNQRGVPKTS